MVCSALASSVGCNWCFSSRWGRSAGDALASMASRLCWAARRRAEACRTTAATSSRDGGVAGMGADMGVDMYCAGVVRMVGRVKVCVTSRRHGDVRGGVRGGVGSSNSNDGLRFSAALHRGGGAGNDGRRIAIWSVFNRA